MSYEREINWNMSGKTPNEARLQKRIAELETEIESLRKDAERYRALAANLDSAIFLESMFIYIGSDAAKITKEMFDAAIDAAMEKQP